MTNQNFKVLWFFSSDNQKDREDKINYFIKSNEEFEVHPIKNNVTEIKLYLDNGQEIGIYERGNPTLILADYVKIFYLKEE
ncbi:MAG: hypothetical protein NXI00_00835 [Cytophagales bacterium]|nr:hypothetical protein [Cytophagales bacterium]